jgi:hypothetical protein
LTSSRRLSSFDEANQLCAILTSSIAAIEALQSVTAAEISTDNQFGSSSLNQESAIESAIAISNTINN